MSFVDTLLSNVSTLGSRPAVIELHAAGHQTTTGQQLHTLVQRARTTLAARGVSPGDRVVLVGPNRARWVATDLAVLAHGAVCVPMYDRQDMGELVAMMHDCTPSLVVVADDTLAAAVAERWPEAPLATWDALFAAEPSTAAPLPRDDADLVTLIYTSGTSGEPKGVMITAGNVGHMLPVTSEALDDLMRRDGAQPPPEEHVFHYLPVCFAGSRIVLWTALLRSQPIRFSVDLDRLIDEVGEAAPHYFLNVPVLLERIKTGADTAMRGKGAAIWWLYQRARAGHERRRAGAHGRRDRLALAVADRLLFAPIRAKLGPNLRFLICGSAPLSEDTQSWYGMLGVPVYQVYGLTETTAIVTMDQPDAVIPGRVGHAIAGCELKVGEQDELLVRGPHIFAGYWNRPEATAACMEGDWFRTGDQVTLDTSGNLAIVGRVKNLLVPTSGHNVAPEPIEAKLMEAIPGLAQAVLVGHGRNHLAALFTGTVREDDVVAGVEAVNAALPFYKRVRAWHVRVEPLTDAEGLLTANGKLRRGAIEAHFADVIDGLYT